MKTKPPTALHAALRADLIATLQKHADGLTAPEMLAVTAHLVGQLVALQDQRIFTPGLAMEIVAANIEQGNRDAISGLLEVKGSA